MNHFKTTAGNQVQSYCEEKEKICSGFTHSDDALFSINGSGTNYTSKKN